MTALPHEPLTVEEFLAWEPDDDELYELVDGHAVLLSNGTARHDGLATAIAAALYQGLRNGPCRVQGPHRALRIGGKVRRPDVLVVCRPPTDEGHEIDADHLVEVLSPATAVVDITTKLLEYLQLPSAKQYMVISPEQRLLHLFTRTELGWHADVLEATTIEFAGVQLDLTAIYDVLDRQSPVIGTSGEGGGA